MSFWAAIVILNLATVIPIIADAVIPCIAGRCSAFVVWHTPLFVLHFCWPWFSRTCSGPLGFAPQNSAFALWNARSRWFCRHLTRLTQRFGPHRLGFVIAYAGLLLGLDSSGQLELLRFGFYSRTYWAWSSFFEPSQLSNFIIEISWRCDSTSSHNFRCRFNTRNFVALQQTDFISAFSLSGWVDAKTLVRLCAVGCLVWVPYCIRVHIQSISKLCPWRQSKSLVAHIFAPICKANSSAIVPSRR